METAHMTNDTTPEWMTDEWLRSAAQQKVLILPTLATEILSLRVDVAELARLRNALTDDVAGAKARNRGLSSALTEARAERDAARAEVERLANERAELMETFQRNEDRAAGIDPHPLNDDAILSRGDIAELVEQAKLKRGEAAGRSMREIAEFEMVCTRSEYVSMANTMARLVSERDAAIRDRNEFAASEVERVLADWWRSAAEGVPWKCGTVDAFFAARAAELRKAAPADWTARLADIGVTRTEHPAAVPICTTPPAAPASAERSGWKGLLADIASAINRHSAESDGGNTPDHLLAEMLGSVLVAFGIAVRAREAWYGRDPMAAAAGQRCGPRHVVGLAAIAAERAGGAS